MKVDSIAVPSNGPGEARSSGSFRQFAETDYAETPLGKFLTELCNECVWSADYTVRADFRDPNDPYVWISHPALPAGDGIRVTANGSNLSLAKIAERLEARFTACGESLEQAARLQEKLAGNLMGVRDRIVDDQAGAMICAAFPDAGRLERTIGAPGSSLYFYSSRGIVYGVRRTERGLRCPVRMRVLYEWWPSAPDDCKVRGYWQALALQFAAAEGVLPTHTYSTTEEVCYPDSRAPDLSLVPVKVEILTSTARFNRRFVVVFTSDGLPQSCVQESVEVA